VNRWNAKFAGGKISILHKEALQSRRKLQGIIMYDPVQEIVSFVEAQYSSLNFFVYYKKEYL
jgi:hypothetical protein